MKFSRVAAAAVLSFAFAGVAFADDSADSSSASGTSDSTVMTQAQDAKALKKQAQKTVKGGRPINTNATPAE